MSPSNFTKGLFNVAKILTLNLICGSYGIYSLYWQYCVCYFYLRAVSYQTTHKAHAFQYKATLLMPHLPAINSKSAVQKFQN